MPMKMTVRENIPAHDMKKYLPAKFLAMVGSKFGSDERGNLIVFPADSKTVVTGRFAQKAFSRVFDKSLVTYCFGSEFSVEAQDTITACNGRAYPLYGNFEWHDDRLFVYKNGEK